MMIKKLTALFDRTEFRTRQCRDDRLVMLALTFGPDKRSPGPQRDVERIDDLSAVKTK